ncbi:hypothetical protein BD626DRAFT_515433 [Schizophyllum amplum]|uniref:Uncharacterized protein n=1 Tax=Schizophyllum amplum TaxID=97359 RepID=A0A550BXF6_9AGAR|nr:hypothetical protein BD626DRAFT_515433 [Auriculariopsis ampla]
MQAFAQYLHPSSPSPSLQKTAMHLILAATSPTPQLTVLTPALYRRLVPLHNHPRYASLRRSRQDAPLPAPALATRSLGARAQRAGQPVVNGCGGFEWAGWLQLHDTVKPITLPLLPFIADGFPGNLMYHCKQDDINAMW